MQKMTTIRNLTTGEHLRGQWCADSPGLVLDHLGPLTDINPGDILESDDGLYAAAIDRWNSSGHYSRVSSVLAVPLDTIAVIRRNGETLIEGVQVSACTIVSNPRLQELLTSSTSTSTPLGAAAKLRVDLQQALALLDERDLDLHQAIERHIDAYDNAYQVILRDGSGTQVGDHVSTGDGLATVQRVDRRTWPGLAILTCTSVEVQPGLFRRLAERVAA